MLNLINFIIIKLKTLELKTLYQTPLTTPFTLPTFSSFLKKALVKGLITYEHFFNILIKNTHQLHLFHKPPKLPDTHSLREIHHS